MALQCILYYYCSLYYYNYYFHFKYSEMTALHLASMNGHQHSIELLLKSGADETMTDAVSRLFYSWCLDSLKESVL